MSTSKHDHHGFREAPGPHGPHGPHGHRRDRRPPEGLEGFGHRFRCRGDVQVAVLLPLAEEPTRGYQLMQTIAEHTDGAWSPSSGAIYPMLNQLKDEDPARTDADGGHKEVSLAEMGRARVEKRHPEWPNPLVSGDGLRLRELTRSPSEAVYQVGRTGTDTQRRQAAREPTDVRRRVYLILAGDEEQVGSF